MTQQTITLLPYNQLWLINMLRGLYQFVHLLLCGETRLLNQQF